MKKIVFSLVSISLLLSSTVFANRNATSIKSSTIPFGSRPDMPVIDNTLPVLDSHALSVAKEYHGAANELNDIPQNIRGEVPTGYEGTLLEGVQIGVGLGALGGANAQLGYRIPYRWHNFWLNRIGFRLDYNTWGPLEGTIDSYMEDNPIDIDGNEFRASLDGDNIGALLDIYPFGGTWGLGNVRLTAGYYNGDFNINGNLTKTDTQSFEIGGISYEASGTVNLSAQMAADINGPYLGAGFDTQLLWGFKMYFDAGLVFIDTPTVTSQVTGNLEIAGVAIDPAGLNELLQDVQDQYMDEVEKYADGYFPMIKFGIFYRF